MNESRGLYDVLGLDRNATQKEIKDAYRRLALEHHPDRNAGSTESHKRFAEIGQAYEILSDPNRRRQYDTFGTVNGRGFRYSENFAETVNMYKERFYKENWDIFLAQIDDSIRILYAGFDPQIDISHVRTHVSKSKVLPILKAEKKDSNVVVTSIAHNFYNYFLGIELREPVAATLMYPISDLFGRYALSGHTNPENAPPITNFQKEYHNRTPIKAFGVECHSPLHAALVIRYLNEVSKLPSKDIFDLVLDKTDYGKIDEIDFNAVGGDGEAALADILKLGFEKLAYYDFDVTNAPELFKRINVDWFDTNNGGSSVHVEFQDQPLPAIPVPYNSILVPTTQEQQKLGLAKEVPAESLNYKNNHQSERLEMSKKGVIADQYHRIEWNNMKWTFNTPNGLDAAMTAFLLTHVLVPTLSYFYPDRLMLKSI
jgi:curved DNA-binding protein CbpA